MVYWRFRHSRSHRFDETAAKNGGRLDRHCLRIHLRRKPQVSTQLFTQLQTIELCTNGFNEQAFFSFAWNGVVWVYCAEIFPTRIKELAVCLCTAMQWLSQFAVARASPSMITNLKGGFFFFFAACLVVMGFLVYFLVPETKGRTLERMDEIFGTAYGDLHALELSAYRRDLELGPGRKGGRSE